MNVLRSAILSNRELVEQLKAAEDSAAHSESDKAESQSGETDRKADEISSSMAFQHDYALATTPDLSAGPLSQIESVQIFQAYESRQHDPPPSASISLSLPAPVIQARTPYSTPANRHVSQPVSQSMPQYAGYESVNEEIRYLLAEWTNTAESLTGEYLVNPINEQGSKFGEPPPLW